MEDYRNIRRPLDFRSGISTPNRLYFSSVGYDLCDEMGLPGAGFREVYNELMAGGAGFGFLGNASIDPESSYSDHGLKLTTDAHSTHLRPLFDDASARNFMLAVQLQHYGIVKGADEDSKRPAFAKAEVNHLTDAEIERLIGMFVTAAIRAVHAGAQTIQIHAANGYLLSSFLSPYSNSRTDRWGGTALRRAEATLEVIRRIRHAIGPEIVIFARVQVDDGLGTRGIQPEGLEEVAAAVACAGADGITCATGIAETFAHFLGNPSKTIAISLEACRRLRAASGLPIGFAGNIGSLREAEAILENDYVDFVGFGRALIADPMLIAKEMDGAAHRVRRCRWDSYCLRDKKNPQLSQIHCCVNPKRLRPLPIQMRYEEENVVVRG